MQTPWTPPYRWVFAAATALGLFSTLQAYRLTTITPMGPKPSDDIEVGKLLVLNLSLWFIPAVLTPIIFLLTRRYRPDGRWVRLLAVHTVAALALSFINTVGMVAVRAALWGTPLLGWMTAGQRLYLMYLDWTLMTYAAIVGLTYSVGYYRESQARALKESQLETQLMEARLRTLEAELQPHFLFNTLHAISTLVHTNPEAADRMISRLSDLLRLTFDRTGEARVPLQEELEFLQKYLEIEQIRFQDRLTLRYEIDPETLDAEVPRLILQPLVENAIKHGVSPRSGQGTVEIASRRDADSLWLEVRDHGHGRTRKNTEGGAEGTEGGAEGSEARAAISGRQTERVRRAGVGLANTRDRLECLYGDAQLLEVSEGDSGFVVRMCLPLRTATRPVEQASRVA